MTSEVALMNRTAVALAADSATTVDYWEDGQRKQRFFKGANKIFNLSNMHPVGLMTYGAGNLQGAPWEVLAKAYRSARGAAAYPDLTNYATDFFDFLVSEKALFPEQYQVEQLTRGIGETAYNIARGILSHESVSSEPDEAKKKEIINKLFSEAHDRVKNSAFISDVAREVSNEAKSLHTKKIHDDFKKTSVYPHIDANLDVSKLLDMASAAFLQQEWTDLQYTGLVFAGYGQMQYFPQLEQYRCYAVLMGKLIYRRLDDDCYSLDHATVSEIVPIAQSEMVNTFMFGSNIPSLMAVDMNFSQALDEFQDGLVQARHIDGSANVDALKKTIFENFRSRTRDYIWRAHTTP